MYTRDVWIIGLQHLIAQLEEGDMRLLPQKETSKQASKTKRRNQSPCLPTEALTPYCGTFMIIIKERVEALGTPHEADS